MPDAKVATRTRGLTLIELMVALSIGALLMAAVTTSLFAMLGNVRANDTSTRARQTATNVMNLIVSTAERAKHVDVDSTFTTLTTTDAGTYANGTWTATSWTQFAWNSQNKTLTVAKTANTTPITVLDDVTFFKLSVTTTAGDLKNPNHYVAITMTLSEPDAFDASNKTSFSLCETALVRCALP